VRRLSSVLMVVMVLAAVVVSTARLAGFRTLADQSNSMFPAIEAGDLLLTEDIRAEQARPGMIVTFPDVTHDYELLTHRVVAVKRDNGLLVFETWGDANPGSEQWTARPDATIGHTIRIFPGAGRALSWLTRPRGAAAFTGLTVTAIVALMLIGGRRPSSPPEGAPEPLGKAQGARHRRARGRGPAAAGHGRRAADRDVVVGRRDRVDDLAVGEVLGAGDVRDEADQDAVAHDLGLEPGGAVVVPDGLAPVRQDHADAVLGDSR
jgi:signal peptidase I